MKERIKERALFLLQMIRNSKRNGSVTPSSRFLAREMVKDIDREKVDTIIELGAGTGIFTKHILQHKKPSAKVIVIEIADTYAKLLQKKFGEKVIVETTDVKHIDQIKKKHGIEKIDLIISGLPIFAAESIHRELKEYLAQGTIFRSFTYKPRMLKKAYPDFSTSQIGFALINIPPARVYQIN